MPNHNVVEQHLAQRLRAANLKATRPRLLILSVLHELGDHHSADELSEILQKRQTPLSRASVYNALDTLVKAGLVMLADAGPGRALYEVGSPWHHHFVCMECGTVINIPCMKGEKPCMFPEWVPGIIEEAQIIFRGCCQRCLSKARQEMKQRECQRGVRPLRIKRRDILVPIHG